MSSFAPKPYTAQRRHPRGIPRLKEKEKEKEEEKEKEKEEKEKGKKEKEGRRWKQFQLWKNTKRVKTQWRTTTGDRLGSMP